MRDRLLILVAVGLLAIAAVLPAQTPAARGTHYHRDGFSGRQPSWVAGDTNVELEEKDHRISTERYYNAPSSEYLKVESKPKVAGTDAEFAHYYYETPPCPVSPGAGSEATASVWIKSFRQGIQLRARVVLPKERDPKNPDAALTTLILGDAYPEEKVRQWHRLTLGNPAEGLRKQLPVLRTKLGRDIDPTDAYIDRLVLNVYAGAGASEMWIDDLDIGPCDIDPKKPSRGIGRPVSITKNIPGDLPGTMPNGIAHPYAVEFVAGRILINKKPFFMRAVRHTGQSIKGLRDINFNTIAFPAGTDPALIDDAVTKNSFMVIAGVPLLGELGNETPVSIGRDADRLAEHFRRFRSGDGVLMWDLGGGRTTEQLRAVSRTAETLREYDPRRPRAVDLWDGYSAYSEYMDVIGSHRWPLFTGLELDKYREWLLQRRTLTAPGKLMWTWVQAHSEPWYLQVATGQPNPDSLDSPLGPQPEQIRLLTYLGLACGYRGLGFWTDRFLAPDPANMPISTTGGAARSTSNNSRDRLIELSFLNTELELLEPILFTAEDEKTIWVPTSHWGVKAAIIRGKKGILVLPMWLGSGSQHCPDQGAIDNLKIVVPLVPEGYDPWMLTPATYENLRSTGGVKSVPGGVEITIQKFDLTAAIVLTNDLTPEGIVVRWQDNIRNGSARKAAQLAKEQALEIFDKVRTVHEALAPIAPDVRGSDDLFAQSRQSIRRAEKAIDNGQPDIAWREARASLRPLRIIMREHWKNATASLTTPTASPYAVGFYTLPKHWELARMIQNAQPLPNVVRSGGFELSEAARPEGAAVQSVPGWVARESHLDAVTPTASIVNVTDEIRDKPPEKGPPPSVQPNLGKHCLKLRVTANPSPLNKNFRPPQALERVSVVAESPVYEVPPKSWVRIGFWVKVPYAIEGSADGVVVFDSVGGEPLAVRIGSTGRWKQHFLYRQAPADGKIAMTFALTGLGEAYFDDLKIEPMTTGSESLMRR